MPFREAPLRSFIDHHRTNSALCDRAADALLPIMSRLVDNGFVFDPLQPTDLEPLRLALQTWIGYSVKGVHVFHLDRLFMPLPGEDERNRTMRVLKLIGALSGLHHTVQDGLDGSCGAFIDTRVSAELQDAFKQASWETLLEVETPNDQTLSGSIMMNYLEVTALLQATAVFTAILDEPLLYERVAPLLPWLAHCVPIGELIDQPGVWTVLTSSAPP